MILRRKRLNITLLILTLILGGVAVCLYRRPHLVLEHEVKDIDVEIVNCDSVATQALSSSTADDVPDSLAATSVSSVPTKDEAVVNPPQPRTTRFKDIEMTAFAEITPFRQEARKILSGQLEETDSASRHKILSYCEHLRAAYPTRDLDFIRQVFSDDALIIVGYVVNAKTAVDMGYSSKVNYSIHSKQGYLERLSRIFATGKPLDVDFSDFKIMRHPTIPGIYGVTLRQKYSCGSYNDDGYLFLLWDFRNPSMPLIHVRTWQARLSIDSGEQEMIDMSDFNLD